MMPPFQHHLVNVAVRSGKDLSEKVPLWRTFFPHNVESLCAFSLMLKSGCQKALTVCMYDDSTFFHLLTMYRVIMIRRMK